MSGHWPGRFEITMLLRNGARARRVARFNVDTGVWRGLWRYDTVDERSISSGQCCEWNPELGGSGCGSRTTSVTYEHLDLGGGPEPRPIKVGVRRYGNREECPLSTPDEPPDAEVFSSWVDNSYQVYHGFGAKRREGALLCTGWDNGRADSSWEACLAQATTVPSTSTCIPTPTCF